MTRLRCAAMVVVLILSGCTAGRGTTVPAAAAHWNAAPCAIMISFGSFAIGIDHTAALRAERLIGAEAGVTAVTRSPPGIEGEYALCVRTASPAVAVRLFEHLRDGLSSPVRAPVSISGPGGMFSTPAVRGRHR